MVKVPGGIQTICPVSSLRRIGHRGELLLPIFDAIDLLGDPNRADPEEEEKKCAPKINVCARGRAK